MKKYKWQTFHVEFPSSTKEFDITGAIADKLNELQKYWEIFSTVVINRNNQELLCIICRREDQVVER